MWWHEYKCDRCGRCENVRTCIIGYYRLAGGRDVPCIDQPVWCYRCDGVRSAERLVDADKIAAFVDHLRNSGLNDEQTETAKLLKKTPEQYLAEQIDMYSATLAWRRARKSPPRCWECGKTDFLELAPDPNDRLKSFGHPSCGGQFLPGENAGHGIQANYRIMDAEGLEWTPRHAT